MFYSCAYIVYRLMFYSCAYIVYRLMFYSCAYIEGWTYLESLESTQEARIAWLRLSNCSTLLALSTLPVSTTRYTPAC